MDDNEAEANSKTYGYHFVDRAGLVEIPGERPRGGVGVVCLHGGTAPGSVTVAVRENIAVTIDDRDHDSVVDKPPHDGSVDLSEEHGARRDLDCIQ